MNPDIDALAVAARNIVNKVGEQALWEAVVALEQWYFVGVGEGEDLMPMVAMFDGRPQLIAFTDEERASEFASASGTRKGRGPLPVLNMEPLEAVEYLVELKDVVHGIGFNPGETGFSAEPMRLRQMFDARG